SACVMEEIGVMRTRTGWLTWLLIAGLALAPTTGRAQSDERPPSAESSPLLSAAWPGIDAGGLAPPPLPAVRGQIGEQPLNYDVPRADPVFPFPLYHDRPEKGGLYLGSQFLWMKQTNPIGRQTIAIRGLVDTDGSITTALGGPTAVAVTQ